MSSSKPSSSPIPRASSTVRRKISGRHPVNHSGHLAKVKKEPAEDEIKEYAANAMSELLGWYGYEKVDSRCTRGLNLDHFASSASPKHYQQPTCLTVNYMGKSSSSSPSGVQPTRASKSPQSRTSRSPPASSISVVSSKDNDIARISPPLSLTTAAASPRVLENSDSASDTPDSSTCSWCGRTGGTWEPGSASIPCGISNNSGRFCSEACFAAGRRAAFKRARTCDWCRHVRHSVSYVDFQDGESQLQFCSDKCLNQYKMNIFCRETQAHLALHGLTSISSNNPNAGGGLITPELWLRDCRSPPQSPDEVDETLVVDDEPTRCDEHHEGERSQSEGSLRDDKHPLSSIDKDILNDGQKRQDDAEASEIDRFQEETEEAIKESLKDEEFRRSQERKKEAEYSKPFPYQISSSNVNANKKTTCSPDIFKESSENYHREGTIYLKDMRSLLGREVMEKTIHQTSGYRSRRISRSPTWLPETPLRFQASPRVFPMHNRPFLPHPMPLKVSPRPRRMPGPPPGSMRPPLHSVHSQIPSTNPPTSILPPVTVLVPYPIPIPIPLPIPIPIPFFGKFFNFDKHEACEKKSDSTATVDTPSATPEDLSPRGKLSNAQSKNIPPSKLASNKDKSHSDSSTSSSPESVTSCNPFATSKTTSPVLSSSSRSTRPLRKRRRQSTTPDDADMRLKRRSKFVPV